MLGDTPQEAAERAAEIRRAQVSPQNAILHIEAIWGRDLSAYDPDGPLPAVDPEPDNLISKGNTLFRGDRAAKARRWREIAEARGLSIRELFDEAADAVEVTRRLWDSWEDDAEIRDAATGRFVDRDKLHHIDFEGAHFSVRGPSITPRPPQGQPLVTALAHATVPYEFAARGADVVFVTPHSRAETVTILAEVRTAEAAVQREGAPLKTFADLVVFLDETPGEAAVGKARLDELDGAPLTSDAEIFTGTPEELADLLLDWRNAGLDGFRLRPGRLPHDLTAITTGLVPELRRRGAFRAEYEADTLRGLLGLPRPENRYAETTAP
ncbi:LLM class flavin-dependent oxidoreductase [Streptosporangium sp. NPDC051023]|uniref:LLM class flavin-dependent oxidoreductase n=1 Tax=Streptosporangium sp. NPDC051023 TaxID=3155410 RepID=UPI00344FC191